MHVISTPTARATLCLAAAALLVTGCASQNSGTGGKPPKLLIATAAAGAAPAAAAAIAPVPGGGADMPMRFGGYVIAGTLPDQPTHAPIYLWPATKPSQSDVVKLGTALGLSGTPSRHTHGWELKTAAGDLRVRDDQGQQWAYDRADAEPCPAFQVDIDNPDGVNGGLGCAVAPTAGTPANGPDEATTKAAAASLLTALGIAGDEQFGSGAPVSYLTVSPKVASLPTQGIETNINVDARGIMAATGQLQVPTAGDDYPLQTAKAAFDSLAARPEPAIAMYCGPIPGGPNRFGGVAPSAGSANGDGTAPSASSSTANGATIASPPPAVAATPTPIAPPVPVISGSVASPPIDASPPIEVSPVPCPTPEPIKITGAKLGLEIEYNATSDGATILVPSWFFTLADGTLATTAIAVDPSYLGTPPQPTDVATEGDTSAGSTGGGGVSGFTAIPPNAPPAVPTAASSKPAPNS